MALAKFRPADLPATLVSRSALHDRLTAGAGQRLTLVVGSAGSGKSVLLSSWAAARPAGMTCWLSCDEADADPLRFWSGFVEAVQGIDPGFGADAVGLLAMDGVMSADVIASIAGDAAELPAGSAIVVDDFHYAGSGVARDMADLVEYWPSGIAQLVLSSRDDPPLRLHRWRMAGELCELGDDDLCFSLAEVGGLLANFGVEVASADLALLHEHSEGWAAALQMAALSLRAAKDPARAARALDVHGHVIAGYFIAEVLDQQSAEVAQFMLDTSVLGELTAGSCAAVTGRQDAEALLHGIGDAGLFLVALDDERTSFRYHHLVGQILRAELQARDPGREQALQLRAAEWLEAVGDARRAARHFLAAGQPGRALALLQDSVVAEYVRDPAQPPPLDLSAADPAVLAGAADGLLALAFDLVLSGDMARGGECLDLLKRAQPQVPSDSGLAFRLAVVRAVRCGLTGQVREAVDQALAARAIQERTHLAYGWADALPTVLLRGYMVLEDFAAVEREAAVAYQTPELAESVRLVLVPGAQALAWCECGDLARAAGAAGAAEAQAGLLGFGQHYFAGDYLRALAGLALERRDLGTAEQLTERALSIAEQRRPVFEFLGLLDRAGIWAARGQVRDALATVETARRILPEADPVLLARADEREALLRLSLGDLRTPAELASGLPAARRGGLLARIALAAGDLSAAQEHLQAAALGDLTPRRALERQLLLAAAAIERDDGAAVDIVGAALNSARHGGFLNTVVTTAPQVTGYLAQQATHLGTDPFMIQLISAALDARATQRDLSASGAVVAEPLTPTELRILKLLTASTYQQIAATLFVSRNTVKTHLRSIYRKLGVTSRAQALERAADLRLLLPSRPGQAGIVAVLNEQQQGHRHGQSHQPGCDHGWPEALLAEDLGPLSADWLACLREVMVAATLRGASSGTRFAPAKFRPPTQPTTLVVRSALHDRLAAGASRRLTVVVGSPGTGKSVLLSSWAAARPAGAASWLSCDKADADPARFWAAFIEACRAAEPWFGADAAGLLAGEDAVPADVAASIANDAAKLPAGSAIVVDDFHYAASAVSTSMNELVEWWPAGTVQLVLSGHFDPPLRLHKLRIAGELCELRDRDLAFSLAESGGLLANFGVEVAAQELALLHEHSEGWAAALQMAALSLRGTADPARIARALEANRHAIAGYFVTEVLDQQPPEIAQFLLDTSVLGELTAGSCTAVTGRQDAAALLRRAHADNLFTVALDDEQTSFRYHRLVRQVLRAELRARDRAREQALHLRAAAWLESGGETRQAACHLVAARQAGRALALLQDRAVADFLETPALPEPLDLSMVNAALLADDPGQILALAADLLLSGDLARGGECLDLLDAAQQPIRPGSGLAARLGATKALRHLLAGQAEPAVSEALAARQILQRTQQCDEWAALLPTIILRGYTWLEDFQAVDREAAAVLATPGLPEPLKQVMVPGAQALAWYESGRLVQAADAAATAETEARRLGFGQHYFAVDYLRALSGLALEHRDFDTAEQLTEQALSISRQRRPAVEFLTLLDQARIRTARGQLSEALAAVGIARRVLAGIGSVLLARADELEAQIRLSLGDLRTVAELAPGLPAARRSLLLAKAVLACGDYGAAGEHLQALPDEMTPRRELVRQLLLAAAAIERGDPAATGIVGGALHAARRGGFLHTVVTTAPQITGYLIEHPASARGEPFTGQLITAALEVRASRPAVPQPRRPLAEPLTPAEQRVLALLPTSTYPQMAVALHVSRNTIKAHTRSVYQKLGATSRAQALERAVDLHLL